MEIKHIRTPQRGDATCLPTHDDVTVLVGPQRDVDRFIDDLGDLRFAIGARIPNVLARLAS